MHKAMMGASLIVGAVLALTACGAPATNHPASESPKAGATPVTAPSAAPIPTESESEASDGKNERGNFEAHIGDTGTLGTAGGGSEVTTKFTVNSIKTPVCDQDYYDQKPKNGRLMAISMTVETTKALAKQSYDKFTISAYDFKFIAANGTTFNGNLSTIATYGCVADSVTFPSSGLGPSEKASGVIIVDIPRSPGVLVYEPNRFGAGFEYAIK